MNKIELIKEAIEKAERLESKLTSEVIEVPFLGSLKIRALLNNLGAISTNYLEIGCHKGGSFCSTIYNNPLMLAIGIDSWASDIVNEDKAYPQFCDNSAKFKNIATYRQIIQEDCFNVNLTKSPWNIITNEMGAQIPDFEGALIDLYNYDAGHSFEDQKNALIYYKRILADEFIYVCDDWQYGEVKAGTIAGIEEGGYEILFEKELLNPEGYTEDQHLNDHWWRGYYVALLKKKPYSLYDAAKDAHNKLSNSTFKYSK